MVSGRNSRRVDSPAIRNATIDNTTALANPVLRGGPAHVARAAAAAAGVALPLTAAQVVSAGGSVVAVVLVAAALTAAVIVRFHGRVEGYKLALVLIALFALVSVAR